MATRLQRAVATLNGIARQELGQHRHRYQRVGCKPHPHEGAHIILCACGKAKGR